MSKSVTLLKRTTAPEKVLLGTSTPSSDMPKLSTLDDILSKYPELVKSKLESVLRHPGTAYYIQPQHTLLTLNGPRGFTFEFWEAPIVQVEGTDVLYLDLPTYSDNILKDEQIKNRRNYSLILSELQLKKYIPDLEKQSSSRFGSLTHLERLQQLTAKGDYFFHSAKGRNFLATCVGNNEKDEPLYRLYEVVAEQGKVPRLQRPSLSMD